MTLHALIMCKRCRQPFYLKPGGAPTPLCSTCTKKWGGLHPDVAHANHTYQVFKQLHGRSAETGKPLSPFERGAAVFLRRVRRA